MMISYPKISGSILIGSRAIMVDGDELKNSIPNDTDPKDIVEYAKSQKYDDLILASSSRFAVLNGIKTCHYGYRKFYYPIDEGTGLYIFASLVQPNIKITPKKLFERYLAVARSYGKRQLYPKIFSTGEIELDLTIKHIDDLDKFDTAKFVAFAMETKRIYSPGYNLNVHNKKHMHVLKKIWGHKRTRPYELSKGLRIALYGKKFYKEHEKTFNKDKYTEFKHQIRYIAHRLKKQKLLWDPAGKKLRQLDLKYGNILYCTKGKCWYYIDFG